MTEVNRTTDARVGSSEFIALLALSIALVALGIDIMLPTLGAIRADLGLPADSTAVAALVTAYFLGLAIGQIGYGPVADRYGRKPVLYAGYAIYTAGALAAALSPTLGLMVVSRFVWGLGAAGPRVVTVAAIRDTFEGDRMARAMSFVMAVFILVPVIAPTLGATIASVASWRWVFGVCVLAAGMMAIWALRMPETLREEHRLELRLRRVVTAARFVASDRQAVGYTLGMTALYGAFLSYLASSEIIIGTTFDRAAAFPYIFSGLAAVMGVAMLANARVVERLGARRVAHGVLLGYLAVSALLLALALTTGGRPPLWLFLGAMALLLSGHALLIPNLNTLAMANMAPVAGTASSLIGAVQIALGAVFGAVVDQGFDGTVRPLALGYLGYGLVALALVLWVDRGRLFAPLDRTPPPVPPPPVAEA